MPYPWVIRLILSLLVVSVAACTRGGSSQPLRNRESSTGVVTGIGSRDENGNVFVRREVRDLKSNYPDQWNLYLLALEWLQQTNESDPHSFYGLASIHGRPYKTWGDAPGLPDKVGTAGYCPHNNQLFLGWHRPYIAFFEQVLHDYMYWIAEEAPADQIDRYVAAADTFRIPYWDWGLGESAGPVPDFYMTESIAVTRPDGHEDTIKNPLYSYRFHNLIPGDFDDKWASLNATVRWPTSDNPDAPSQQELFASAYSRLQRDLYNELGVVFRATTFEDFAGRIDNPHGWMHGVIGGGWDDKTFRGHFWPLEYSAFEPLFMHHHTNVDRLFAIYQAAYPDRLMETSNVSNQGNVFLEYGQAINADTELLPFRKNSSGYWTTKDCWDHRVLGYDYPETQRWRFNSDEEYRASVETVISTLYSGSLQAQLMPQNATAGGIALLLATDGTFNDWTIETQASPRGLPSTFVVRFSFVGDFSSDASIDAGMWMVLNPTDTHKPENTTKHAAMSEQTYKGTIGLTAHLLDQVAAGKLDGLDPKDVIPYLKDKLTWKVYSGDGDLIPQCDLDALTVEIFSSIARISDNLKLPIAYQNVTAHPEVTMGKKGGITA